MFVPDFQVLQGVLPIEPLNTRHDPLVMIAPDDGPRPPDPCTNLVVKLAPGDGPLPPDPK